MAGAQREKTDIQKYRCCDRIRRSNANSSCGIASRWQEQYQKRLAYNGVVIGLAEARSEALLRVCTQNERNTVHAQSRIEKDVMRRNGAVSSTSLSHSKQRHHAHTGIQTRSNHCTTLASAQMGDCTQKQCVTFCLHSFHSLCDVGACWSGCTHKSARP